MLFVLGLNYADYWVDIIYKNNKKIQNEQTVLASRTPTNEQPSVVLWALEGPFNSLSRPYQDQEGHSCG